MESFLSEDDLRELGKLDTCAVADAIETFDLRAKNVGFADSSVRCLSEDLPPMVGYAATARMRSGDRPMAGRSYHDRTAWWKSILEVPAPRIAVLEDIDDPPGLGAFLGDVHAGMLQAMGCIGYVTNGAVRKLRAVRDMGFHVYAHHVAVSHVYARIIEFGSDVQIGGMEVRPGDLLHGDRHGVLHIPKPVATEIPRAAARIAERNRQVLAVCHGPNFSLERLRVTLEKLG